MARIENRVAISLAWDPSMETIAIKGGILSGPLRTLKYEGIDALDIEDQIDTSDFLCDLAAWALGMKAIYFPDDGEVKSDG